jgi:hypothetical protein
MTEAGQEPQQPAAYWGLIRDVGVLQLKLIVDGFRDLVLLPASLIAGIVSLANGENGRPGPQFYRLIAVGKQSEEWINLFGALRNAPPETRIEGPFAETDIDDIVARVEKFVVDEYRRGGVTAQAKERIDRALRTMQEKKNSGTKGP